MNTESAVQAATVTPAITNPIAVFAPVTSETLDRFTLAILNGTSTAKILPASITDLKAAGALSKEQLEAIKQARKDHEAGADANRHVLFTLAKARRVRGARFNREDQLIGLRFADKK